MLTLSQKIPYRNHRLATFSGPSRIRAVAPRTVRRIGSSEPESSDRGLAWSDDFVAFPAVFCFLDAPVHSVWYPARLSGRIDGQPFSSSFGRFAQCVWSRYPLACF
jgi:hypothetical protein